MKRLVIVAALVLFCTSASASVIFFDEPFDYDIGLLEDVSGGVWQNIWGTPDWACVAKMALADSYDMNAALAEFANPLPIVGKGKVSFDFYVHEEGEFDLEPYLWFENASENIFEIFVDLDNNIGTTDVYFKNAFSGGHLLLDDTYADVT